MKLPTWFDVNGSFGCSATVRPEFPTPAHLLARMDRLGIGSAIVFHIAARDYNPHFGNQRLLDELAAASDRLLPAFVIGPSLLYERGAMEQVEQAFASRQVRAIRLCPATLRHPLAQVEPILAEIAGHKPVVLVDRFELNAPNDLLQLAGHFPGLSFIYTQTMWPQFATVLDLMARRDNILVDTSWLHMRGAVELIIEKFGVRRLVFGAGPHAHNGASIAELMDVPITDPDKELIAHENIESLLGVTTRKSTAPSCQGHLWQTLLEGKPLDLDVVDAHGHLGTSGLWMHAEGGIEEETADLLRRMDRIGIRTAIISGGEALLGDPVEGNFALEKSLRPHGDRFRGYVVFNPLYAGELKTQLDDYFSRSFFVGFKLLCDYWRLPVTDPRLETVWEHAHSHRMPILLHTWDGPYNQPGMLKDIVKRFPEAVFLLGHSGGGETGRLEAEELAGDNPNVYLEWCGSFCCSKPFEETLRRVSPRQVVFGTDATAHSPAWELGRLLSMDLPDDTLVPILGANMRKILDGRR
ncbi:MAG: amidohydrolase family protein [Verrucomicrobiae bacterium]